MKPSDLQYYQLLKAEAEKLGFDLGIETCERGTVSIQGDSVRLEREKDSTQRWALTYVDPEKWTQAYAFSTLIEVQGFLRGFAVAKNGKDLIE